jgi:hypothetical protein
MTHPFCGRDEGKERPQQGIMTISTARIEHLARRVANKPPGSISEANQRVLLHRGRSRLRQLFEDEFREVR